MLWLKRDRWKAGIAVAGMLLLLVLMVWVPVAAAGTDEGALGLAMPVMGTVQATPTEDATVTSLNKEKLTQEVAQQRHSWENWLWSNAGAVSSTLVIVLGAFFGLWRWLGDRRDAQDKDLKAQAEERFKTAVTALGDGKEGVQVGGAILLRSFLHKGDKQRYYNQVFDLAVAYLRLPRTSPPPEDPDGIPHSPEDQNAPLPLTTLSQALTVVFKEAFPLARDERKRNLSPFEPRSLDASRLQLDSAYLAHADLNNIWMREAFLRRTNLGVAKLSNADLKNANLTQAHLGYAHLDGANLSLARLDGAYLYKADLSGAKLLVANLSRTDLSGADLSGADLSGANLSGANLSGANLSGVKFMGVQASGAYLSVADLSQVKLTEVKLRGANLSSPTFFVPDLSDANPEKALSLKDTNLCGVKGLTKEQLEFCKAKGAIIDEDITISPPQSPVSPPPPSQSKDAQTPSIPPAQVSTPPPETDGSHAPSSQQSPE